MHICDFFFQKLGLSLSLAEQSRINGNSLYGLGDHFKNLSGPPLNGYSLPGTVVLLNSQIQGTTFLTHTG